MCDHVLTGRMLGSSLYPYNINTVTYVLALIRAVVCNGILYDLSTSYIVNIVYATHINITQTKQYHNNQHVNTTYI